MDVVQLALMRMQNTQNMMKAKKAEKESNKKSKGVPNGRDAYRSIYCSFLTQQRPVSQYWEQRWHEKHIEKYTFFQQV